MIPDFHAYLTQHAGWPPAPGWPARLALLVPLGVYLFVWPFGLALLSLGWLPPGAGWVGGVLLMAQGLAFTAWLGAQVGPGRALAAAGLIGAGAWALEAVGVLTGVPFGPYRYTPALGAWLGPVPVAIPFAWIAGVGSATFLAQQVILDFRFWILDWKVRDRQSKIQNPKSKIVLLAALLATALDGVLETVATRVQGYWTWLTEPGAPGTAWAGIPWANFATWAAASLLFSLVLYRLTAPGRPRRPAYSVVPGLLYTLNLVMFGVVNAAHGFAGPALLALGLLLTLGLAARGMRHEA